MAYGHIYLCLSICMHICVSICLDFVCICVSICKCTLVLVLVYVCVCALVCACAFACLYTLRIHVSVCRFIWYCNICILRSVGSPRWELGAPTLSTDSSALGRHSPDHRAEHVATRSHHLHQTHQTHQTNRAEHVAA